MKIEGVGGRILQLRLSQHYTREELAEKLDISAKFLYEIETEKKGISANTLLKLATVFSVSSDYILTGRF